MANNRIVFFDTTLRDGEQSPGCSMTTQEKLTMAHALEDLGVDIIEAGFAMASEGDFAAIATITQAVRKPRIASLARANTEDIEMAARALQFADRARIHVFLASSDLHLEYKLKIGRAQALDLCGESVRLACFLGEIVRIAVQAGATTINMPDTVGYTTPEEYAQMFLEVRERVPAIDDHGIILSSHCHYDLGLAVANSLAAITAGDRRRQRICPRVRHPSARHVGQPPLLRDHDPHRGRSGQNAPGPRQALRPRRAQTQTGTTRLHSYPRGAATYLLPLRRPRRSQEEHLRPGSDRRGARPYPRKPPRTGLRTGLSRQKLG